MDIGFESKHWRPAPTAPASGLAFGHAFGGECGNAPEWLELRARLGAAWSARRELGHCDRTSALRCGSFDRTSALALAGAMIGFEPALLAVNPNALGNLKSPEGKAGQHTGDLTPGGRG